MVFFGGAILVGVRSANVVEFSCVRIVRCGGRVCD